MHTKKDVLEYEYNIGKQEAYNRLTLIPVDWDEDKKAASFSPGI
jgi:hypothetical protein